MLAQLRRAAIAPLWIAQLASGTKSFERNLVIGSRRLNQWGRHACPGPADPQTVLHADTFHPTVKAWLFLTDVAEEAGPFTYVPGSHRLSPERLDWERRMSLAARHSPNAEIRQGSFRIDQAELPSLGLPQPRSFAVPGNTLVVADTFGFHARGPSNRPSLRVEIWAYGRRSPFLPWATLFP